MREYRGSPIPSRPDEFCKYQMAREAVPFNHVFVVVVVVDSSEEFVNHKHKRKEKKRKKVGEVRAVAVS